MDLSYDDIMISTNDFQMILISAWLQDKSKCEYQYTHKLVLCFFEKQ